MKDLSLLLLAVCVISHCFAQDDRKEPSPTSVAYHDYRQYETVPPYGLEKVKQLIKYKTARSTNEDDDQWTDSLPEKLYRSLSFRERFTYNMIYEESFSQNCDIDQPVVDEEKKIFGHLARERGEGSWSDRQAKFFDDNKDSAIALMTESIGRAKRVGLNYKYVIVYINATSMIPTLIDTYNMQKKDRDILTVLMLLMLNGKYTPFMESLSCKKLYVGKDTYYDASLAFNSANEALIIQRATDFYNGLGK